MLPEDSTKGEHWGVKVLIGSFVRSSCDCCVRRSSNSLRTWDYFSWAARRQLQLKPVSGSSSSGSAVKWLLVLLVFVDLSILVLSALSLNLTSSFSSSSRFSPNSSKWLGVESRWEAWSRRRGPGSPQTTTSRRKTSSTPSGPGPVSSPLPLCSVLKQRF